MNGVIKLDKVLKRKALDAWLASCRLRMGHRYPKIDFDSDCWPLRTLHQTAQPDWNFVATTEDFAGKDRSFCDVARCLVAEMMIAGKPKDVLKALSPFRRLADTASASIYDVTVSDLRALEANSLEYCEQYNFSANRHLSSLIAIASQLSSLARKNVISNLGYYVDATVTARLRVMHRSARAKTHKEKAELLDHKIEAFNDAVNAMLDEDSRLDPMDHVALCVLLRNLCAPSRINEVLCCSIDDHVTVEDYAHKEIGIENVSHKAHQLLVTMKGSKGAQWSAKPVLTFMIDAFHFTEDIIKRHSQRSRMLVAWYQANPTSLYLPPELEYLRGEALSRQDVAKIIYLTETARDLMRTTPVTQVFNGSGGVFEAPNPDANNIRGSKNRQRNISFIPWAEAEGYLLKQVHQAMADCRKVTPHNHYQGDLSKMLFLFDRDELPYLPFALSYQPILKRIKRTEARKKSGARPTVFEKLKITMPVKGEIKTAEMETHDPRRWLTTMALRHGEELSDVLVNKWANRSSLAQLKAYDFRTADELAAFSRMPDVSELTELSVGLEQARKLEDTYGLESDIVIVHDAGVRVTSLDRVLKGVEDRPIAKTSEQVIIVYPTRYGVCLHQHHETPCMRYDTCLTCKENVCIKGHRPTNDAILEDESRVTRSIINQLKTLVAALNRGVADCPDLFMEHLSLLVNRGLCLEQMTDHLVADFHDIKDQIKDKLLRKRLEEAFVTRGYKDVLQNGNVAEGALMKYHNPRQHAAPGMEIALSTHGGREQVTLDEQMLVAKFPEFAPMSLGLKDERHLLKADDEEEDD